MSDSWPNQAPYSREGSETQLDKKKQSAINVQRECSSEQPPPVRPRGRDEAATK